MRESAFREAIRRRLPKALHWQPTTGGLNSNGTPDTYVDGPKSDLWIEWKTLDAMPRSDVVRGRYSGLQRAWMTRRHDYSHGPRANVVGIVGLPNKTAVVQTTPEEWQRGTPVSAAIKYDEVAAWICAFCGVSYKAR